MNRRYFLYLSAGATIGLSGCQQSKNPEPTTTEGHNKVLEILPQVRKASDGWVLKATVWNVYAVDTSFHDVRLLVYAADGKEICEEGIGDLLKPTGEKKTIEITCPEFPAIITATARESPCANAVIPVVYWTGTDAQKTATIAPDEIVWKDVYRKCGENLPPQRVLNKLGPSSTEQE